MRCHVKCRGRGRGWACGRAAVCDGRAFHRYFSDSGMYLANCICQMQKIGLIEFCISTGGRAGVCDGRGGHLRIKKLDNSKLGSTQQWMTLTCCQDHILTENIWFVWSETSYSGDERRCYRCGTTTERTNTEDRATQPMEDGGWVSQFEDNANYRNIETQFTNRLLHSPSDPIQ